MKGLFLFLFLGFSNPSFGIESVLSGLDSINSNSLDCSKMSNQELANLCAHQVCGPPKSKSLTISMHNAQDYLSKENFKKLQGLEADLRSYYDHREKQVSSLINEFNKRKSSPNFSDISKWDDQSFNSFIDLYWNKMNLDVDYSNPLEERTPKLLMEKKDPDYHIFQELIENFNTTKDPLRALRKGIITFEEFKALAIKQAHRYSQELELQKKTSSFNSLQYNFRISSGVNDQEAVTQLYEGLIADAKSNGIVLEPSSCKEHCKRGVASLIKNFDPATLKKNLQNDLKLLSIEDRVALCKASFLSSHVENKRQEDFSRMWPEIRESFINNVFSQFSKHSQNLLINYLDTEVSFYFSDPYKTKVEDVSRSLSMTPSWPTPFLMRDSLVKLFPSLIKNLFFVKTAPLIEK